MKRYNVNFEKNGIYQTNLVETDKSPVDVGLYYRDVKKAAHVFGVDYATADDERPGNADCKNLTEQADRERINSRRKEDK